MKHCKVPSLLAEALKKLDANLKEDLSKLWPAREGESDDEGREMHEANMVLHLGAILKNNAHIYTEVSTDLDPKKRIDFVAISRKKDWVLVCEAKRGYSTNHIIGISGDIKRIVHFSKSEIPVHSKAKRFGLLLITVWEKSGGRALIKAWENSLEIKNKSDIANACRDVIRKLDYLNAKRDILIINDYGDEGRHYLLYAVFKIILH